jgi:hypothetical protein
MHEQDPCPKASAIGGKSTINSAPRDVVTKKLVSDEGRTR